MTFRVWDDPRAGCALNLLVLTLGIALLIAVMTGGGG